MNAVTRLQAVMRAAHRAGVNVQGLGVLGGGEPCVVVPMEGGGYGMATVDDDTRMVWGEYPKEDGEALIMIYVSDADCAELAAYRGVKR